MPPLREFLPWLPYPLVMILGYALFALMQLNGVSLLLSTYAPILTTVAIVMVLETVMPQRATWRPNASEVGTDLIFMGIVQLAFPPMMGFLFAWSLVEPARVLEWPVTQWWPHRWPIWLQAVLMVFTVDFLRYWLHRAAHENNYLWRLHAVHHSVEQLYWLNTSRFHPVEKALQMSLDSLPFLLMGVDERVLALYYLSYAINGFFQHCNIRLRYGFLNYLVGSAETHRWHHSRLPAESNRNYGNTVIVWDLLFGTWYLPRDREIAELGLQDRDYPKTFLRMMAAPFVRNG